MFIYEHCTEPVNTCTRYMRIHKYMTLLLMANTQSGIKVACTCKIPFLCNAQRDPILFHCYLYSTRTQLYFHVHQALLVMILCFCLCVSRTTRGRGRTGKSGDYAAPARKYRRPAYRSQFTQKRRRKRRKPEEG